MRLLALVVAASFAACAPDPVLGAFNYTVSGTDMTTTGTGQGMFTVSGTGTMVVTTAAKGGYLVVLSAPNLSCTLTADPDRQKPGAASVPTPQNCAVSVNGNGTTATLTSARLSVDQNVATLNVSYTYTGTLLLGLTYSGNGSRTFTGPRI
jgi:hypothetical protein